MKLVLEVDEKDKWQAQRLHHYIKKFGLSEVVSILNSFE